ncbi:MAG: hypothetical protein ACXIUQ_06410 [Cecembia sp.]
MVKRMILLFFACILFKSNVVFAQFGLMAGTNYSNLRQQTPRIDTGPQLNFHLGLNYSWHPIEKIPNFSIRADLLLNNKGYRQILNDGHRQVRFNAMGFAPMLRYQIAKTTGLHSGLEFNYFFDGNTVGSSEVFRQSERAVFLGIDLLNHRSVSFYIRGVFGISPLLNYVDFNPLDASIKGEFSDFFSTTVLFGIQFSIQDEKKRN